MSPREGPIDDSRMQHKKGFLKKLGVPVGYYLFVNYSPIAGNCEVRYFDLKKSTARIVYNQQIPQEMPEREKLVRDVAAYIASTIIGDASSVLFYMSSNDVYSAITDELRSRGCHIVDHGAI